MKIVLAFISVLICDSSFAQIPVPFSFMRGGGTAPTFVQEAETGWLSSSLSLTTSSFNVQAGDILVAYAGAENDDRCSLGISGGSLTWTLRQSINYGLSDWTMAYVWTTVVDTNKAMTVSFTVSGTALMPAHGGNVLTFRNSSGVGASTKSNVDASSPLVTLTTTKPNSAVVVFTADWNAVDGATRTWRTGAGALTELTYDISPTHYTVYGGYHANVGPVSACNFGLTTPANQKYSIVAIEVKGP